MEADGTFQQAVLEAQLHEHQDASKGNARQGHQQADLLPRQLQPGQRDPMGDKSHTEQAVHPPALPLDIDGHIHLQVGQAGHAGAALRIQADIHLYHTGIHIGSWVGVEHIFLANLQAYPLHSAL